MKNGSGKYDVIILGGGIAGSVMAISLKRKNPSVSILVIERSSVFPNKVGESSAEMTGLFFNRFQVDHIIKKQVQKTGLRFLFNEHNSTDPLKTDEFSSPSVKSIANGYHFNRQQFDEDLLAEAVRLGVELLRPAVITGFRFEKLNCRVSVMYKEEEREYQATWLVDASGTERIAGKKMGWSNLDLRFDTAASFAHFSNLRPASDWDKMKSDFWKKYAIGPPSNSTIHFLRKGCWWWHIKLNNETVSIGVVYDKNILGKPDPEKFYNDFLEKDEMLNYMTQGSTRSDIRHLPALPYLSSRLYDEGLVVVGDAAAFVDPLFSPGIEFTCHQSLYLTGLITDYFKTGKVEHHKWRKYERLFIAAFSDRMKVYRDRYNVMGSYDIFSNWVQLDFFGYFGFTVFPSVLFPSRMKIPPRFFFPSGFVYRFLTRRYLAIAARREREGRASTSLAKPLSHSYVGIPSGPRFFLKVPQLFFIWAINYCRIEMDELRYTLFPYKRK